MPGAPLNPAENSEHAEQQQVQYNEKSVQVRAMSNYCEHLSTKDADFTAKIKDFLTGAISRDRLKEYFRSKLKNCSPRECQKMGIADNSFASIDAFLSETQAFENQLLYEIEFNGKIRRKAKDELIEGCVLTATDEYEMTQEHKQQLRQALEEENINTLKVFLENPRFRKKRLQKYIPVTLRDKTLSDINFTKLYNDIANLSPTDPNSAKIKDVWNRMMGGFKIREGESPQQAFERIQAEGSEGDLTADYEAFFSCPDSLISAENKTRILDFLTRQFVPIAPIQAIEQVDAAAGKAILNAHTPPLHDIATADPERNEALKIDRKEIARMRYQQGLLETMVSTRGLSMKTKIRLLGNFGSKKQIQQKNEFYSGRPGGIQSTSADFEETFQTIHKMDPKEVMSHDGLTTQLISTLQQKIKNTDFFQPGNVMIWKTKTEDGKDDLIGYYAIDEILGDDPEDADAVVKLRFLGNNKNETLSRSGIPRYYSGPQFFDYLSNCADNGEINFIGGGSEFESKMIEDKVRFQTAGEIYEELSHKYERVSIPDIATLNARVDKVMNPGNEKLEADKPEARVLKEGMIMARWTDSGGKKELYTFQVESIDEEGGTITLWDGWGKGDDARETYTFDQFYTFVKEQSSEGRKLFRVPTGGKKFGVEQFNTLMRSEPHNLQGEGAFKKNNKVTIREKDGKYEFGELDKSGNFRDKTIIKIDGGKRDLHIESIEGESVHVRIGTFTQTKYDKDKHVIEKHPKFEGSGTMVMPLSWLWGYLQTHPGYKLDKPDNEPKEKQDDPNKKPSMSWLNIIKSAHSLGVVLHGDLWKQPHKAWEEQHHKDHAFSGKLTAALAIEKLQGVSGPVGWGMRWAEWPYLMVGDSNSTLQSYLNELVERIDGMGSHHRVRLIRKWGACHFPDPKFMAAMFASMQIFGQLYPYDFDDKDDIRRTDWYWYNNVRHAVHNVTEKDYPHHMPPHNEDDWPVDKEGNKRSEMSMIYDMMNTFKHPVLRNLGRRFEKYMNKGHEHLKEGGPGNLNRRPNMEDKLDWMMSTVLSAKTTEAFGESNKLWLQEGYPTEVTTMPYAAMLFAHREQQMLPGTYEHLRQEFQGNTKVPMFAFAQNRSLGHTFRETGIAMAYSISPEVGAELKRLCNIPNEGGRLHGGETSKKWKKDFEALWRKHGKVIMDKISGMRDPMIQIMVKDKALFDDLLKDMPAEKQQQYREVHARSHHVQAYYERMWDMQNSANHSKIRGGAFYDGDNFRYRESFDNGYPTFWIDWDGFIDANLENDFVKGDGGTTGDGVFNDMRGFFDDIPNLARKMAKQMGMEGNKAYIHKISKSIYEKNIQHVTRLMDKAKFHPHVKCSYYNVAAMILGMSSIRSLTDDSMTKEKEARFEDYKQKMLAIDAEAKKMAASGDFAGSLEYRTKWWKRFEQIVPKEENTIGKSLDEVLKGGSGQQKKDATAEVTTEVLEKTEEALTGGKSKRRRQ